MALNVPSPAGGSQPPDVPDHELLARWIGGEEAALTALVARHRGLVRAACRRQLDAQDAEDAAQAVFLVLVRKPAAAARAPALAAWLLTVARHVCLTARRSHGRRARAEQEAAMRHVPAAPLADPEIAGHLDEALARLSAPQRAAIALHYFAGRSHAEIAAELRCPVNTVYSHLHRGLERLRSHLARRGAAVSASALLALLAAQGAVAADAPTATGTAALPLGSERARALADAACRSSARRAVLAAATAALAAAATWAAIAMRPQPAAAGAGAPTVERTGRTTATSSASIDAPAPPTDLLGAAMPPGTVGMLRLNDVPRSLERWRAGPYGRLAATPWGQRLAARVLAARPALSELIALQELVTRAALGVCPRSDGGADIACAMATRDPLGLEAALRRTVPPAALARLTFTREDALLRIAYAMPQSGGMGASRASDATRREPPIDVARGSGLPPAMVARAQTPDADVELAYGETAWLLLLRQDEQADASTRMHPAPTSGHQHVSLRIVPEGLRERDVSSLSAEQQRRSGPDAWPLLRSDILADLPATTLGAIAVSIGPALAEHGRELEARDREGRSAAALLAALGLPSASELVAGLRGSARMWVEQGQPLPSVTIDIGMERDLAERLLARLAAAARLPTDADGGVDGWLGPLRIDARWRDGRLLATSHPAGVPGLAARSGGFVDLPDVARARREIPADGACIIGLSRGAESWATLAQFAAPALAAQGGFEAMSLPRDLRGAAGYGFLWSRPEGDRLVTESGGLFGGALGTVAAAGVLAAAIAEDPGMAIGAVGRFLRSR